LVVVSSAHADASFLLGGMHSEQVFEVTLLWNNGASYRQYAYVDEEQGICEIGASGEVGRCQIDLLPVSEAFKQIAVVEYIPRLPDSIHWGVEGNTPVVVAAIFKEWGSTSQRASQWQIACSVMPDNETQAVCLQEDRMDHCDEWSEPCAVAGLLNGEWLMRTKGLMSISTLVLLVG
jgi:hypothetical protein